ncbi:MAG: class I SAM-dependent methyltransferase [Flavobacteriales bacterium]|nr:class I SAM-dependent methyltransferase [Flavobacteriales bacterium]
MSMVPQEYERMAALEETMWWYHGLHTNVVNALQKHAGHLTTLLDAGCGTGGTLKAIARRFPQARLHGLDIAEQACAFTREKTGATVTVGSVDALPYTDASFDALVSCDVLGYRIDVGATLHGFHRVLRPGGICVLNMAAYPWMLSYHDKAVGQVRRYTRSEAEGLLREHGFRLIFASYWNTVLFPLMLLRRKVLPAPPASDVTPFNPLANGVFRACVGAESALLNAGLPLPFGGSVLLIAQRP